MSFSSRRIPYSKSKDLINFYVRSISVSKELAVKGGVIFKNPLIYGNF